MDPALVTGPSIPAPQPTFEDGLGERRFTVGASSEPLELLRLNTALSAVSSFEFALRERAGRLASFRPESYARVRAVEADRPTSALVVVSDYVPGVRLSTLLLAAETGVVSLEGNAARGLIRQLVNAVAAWQEAMPDVCHGAIGPERIVVTPGGRLVVVEYVLGSALEQLQYSPERYWRDLGVAVPAAAGGPTFDSRADALQLGMVALALILGRRLTADESPEQIYEVVSGAVVRSATSDHEPLPTELREWLMRALQLDPFSSFASALDVRADLDRALGAANPVAELGALQAFLTGYREMVGARDVTRPDTAPDPDLVPRLEAMRAFLARYPLRRPVDPPPAEPAAKKAPDTAPAASLEAARTNLETARTNLETARTVSDAESDTWPTGGAADEGPPQPTLSYEMRSATPVVLAWPRRWLAWPRAWRIAAGGALGLIAMGLVFAALWFLPSNAAETGGVLTVGTSPAGISVFVDGTSRGVTPLSVELPPGEHVLELATASGRRRIPVTITAGNQVSQFLELSNSTAATGELQVRTEPSQASVTVDGQFVGRSPLSVSDLAAGTHTVELKHESGSLTERVLIENGKITSLVVPIGAPTTPGAAGWISVSAPADVQVSENGRLLGTSSIDRIMLPVGRHDLDISHEALGYRQRRTVQVTAGQVTQVRLNWPDGSLALNAIPWAEVWIDGRQVGETPIGSLSVPIGTHEVVFRHPELGERRSSVTVTAGAPAKVGVDLRTK